MNQRVTEHRRYTATPDCVGMCKLFKPNADLALVTYQAPGMGPLVVLHEASCERIKPLPTIDETIAELRAAITAAEAAR